MRNDFKKINISKSLARKIYNSGGIVFVVYKDSEERIISYKYIECGISFDVICNAYLDRDIDIKFKTNKESYEAHEMCDLMCDWGDNYAERDT